MRLREGVRLAVLSDAFVGQDAMGKLIQSAISHRPTSRFTAVWDTLIMLASRGIGGEVGQRESAVSLAALQLVTCVTCTKSMHPQLLLPGQDAVTCPVPIDEHSRTAAVSSLLNNAHSTPSSSTPSSPSFHSASERLAGPGVNALTVGGDEEELDRGYVVMDIQALLQLLVDILDRGAPAMPAMFRTAAAGLEKMIANHFIFSACDMSPVISWLTSKLASGEWGWGIGGEGKYGP